MALSKKKKVREKSRECHNPKPQPFQDTKRRRTQTKPKKRKSNKRTKSTKISSLFPKRGNFNTKRTVSGVHVCLSEHSDSSFVYGFMSLDYGFGTMTGLLVE